MATFRFDIQVVRKDGTREIAGEIRLTHEDYEGHNEQTALAHLTEHRSEYGLAIDQEMSMVLCGGVMLPLSDFSHLETRLASKSVI